MLKRSKLNLGDLAGSEKIDKDEDTYSDEYAPILETDDATHEI